MRHPSRLAGSSIFVLVLALCPRLGFAADVGGSALAVPTGLGEAFAVAGAFRLTAEGDRGVEDGDSRAVALGAADRVLCAIDRQVLRDGDDLPRVHVAVSADYPEASGADGGASLLRVDVQAEATLTIYGLPPASFTWDEAAYLTDGVGLDEALLDLEEKCALGCLVSLVIALDPSSFSPLLLADDDSVRRSAYAVAARHGDPPAPVLLEALWDGEEDLEIRQFAATALGRTGPAATATSALTSALHEVEPGLRSAAASALGVLGAEAKAAVPALARALGDESWLVRSGAAEALGQIGPAASVAVPPLIHALGDPEQHVRLRAVQALGRIGPGAAASVPTLVRILHDEHEDVTVQASAAQALGGLGSAGVPALVAALREGDPFVREMAALALGKADAPSQEVVATLIGALRDRELWVARAAAVSLGEMGPGADAAAPYLRLLLRSPEEPLREAAEDALDRIQGVREWWERTFDEPYPGDGTRVCQTWDGGSAHVVLRLESVDSARSPALGCYQRVGDELELKRAFLPQERPGMEATVAMDGPFGLYVWPASKHARPQRPWYTEDSLNAPDDATPHAWVFDRPGGGWVIAMSDRVGGAVCNDLIVSMEIRLGEVPASEDMLIALSPSPEGAARSVADTRTAVARAGAGALREPAASPRATAVEPPAPMAPTVVPSAALTAAEPPAASGALAGPAPETEAAAVSADTRVAVEPLVGEQFAQDSGRQRQPAVAEAVELTAPAAGEGVERPEGRTGVSEDTSAAGGPQVKRTPDGHRERRRSAPISTVTFLAAELSDGDPASRVRAARELRAMGASALPDLTAALQDGDAEVRAAAVTALGKVGPSAVAALAQATASDADPDVRSRAAAALGEIGSAAASAVPQLARALADPAPRVRFDAAQALGCIGPAAGGAAPQLGKVIVSEREEIGIRRKAVQALGMMGPEAGAGIPFLAEAAKDMDTWLRVCAAEALGKTAGASQAARTALEGLLTDGEEPVRRAAGRALERLDGSGE